jgi:hypothetical protein
MKAVGRGSRSGFTTTDRAGFRKSANGESIASPNITRNAGQSDM